MLVPDIVATTDERFLEVVAAASIQEMTTLFVSRRVHPPYAPDALTLHIVCGVPYVATSFVIVITTAVTTFPEVL